MKLINGKKITLEIPEEMLQKLKCYSWRGEQNNPYSINNGRLIFMKTLIGKHQKRRDLIQRQEDLFEKRALRRYRAQLAKESRLRDKISRERAARKLSYRRIIRSLKDIWSRLHIIYDRTSCWEHKFKSSTYATCKYNGITTPFHRLIYNLSHNTVMSPNLFACHSCDNPKCGRPSHIFPGTPSQNSKDSYFKGRQRAAFRAGGLNPNRKLSERNVKRIKKLIALGFSDKLIGEKFSVTPQCINLIRKKIRWVHVLG